MNAITYITKTCTWIVVILMTTLFASCSDEKVDADEMVLIDPFGGDLYREITADGGSIVLFDSEDVNDTRYYNWCYMIDRPLSYIDEPCSESFKVMLDALYPNWETNSPINIREILTPYAITAVLPEGFDCDAITPDCTLYYTYDAYNDKRPRPYPWSEDIPMYFDKDMSYVCTAEWCEIRFHKGKITVTATPNDTGDERYMSLVYDFFMFPYVGRGAIQISQPAM